MDILGGAQGAICAPACKYGHDLLIGKHFLQLLDDLIFMDIYFSNPGNPCLNLLEDFLAISKTRSWALFAIEAPPFRGSWQIGWNAPVGSPTPALERLSHAIVVVLAT